MADNLTQAKRPVMGFPTPFTGQENVGIRLKIACNYVVLNENDDRERATFLPGRDQKQTGIIREPVS